MKKNATKVITMLLLLTLLMPVIVGCKSNSEPNEEISGSQNNGDSVKTGDEKQEIIEINFPTMWIGVSQASDWFSERLETFNEEHKGSIRVVVEEIAGDQAYVDKMKVLYASNSLPDIINTGGYNLIDSMKDEFIELNEYLDEDFISNYADVGWHVNSRDGKIYGIPYTKQVFGYFYNKELFDKAGIDQPAETWQEFFEQCEKLKAAGITPLSMDTADSGWITSLMMCAMIADSDEGEKFMNERLPKNYNTDEFIAAATKIQELFQNYTTSDAVGGKYENAASNFLMGETAIIANGPWMVSDFYNTDMVDEGFADHIRTAQYPGGVMYNSAKVGFHVAAKTEEKIQASLEFIKFLVSEESQKLTLEKTGDIPTNLNVESDEVYPLVMDVIENGKTAKRSINDFQSLWYPNVVDEISVQYPLLALGEITPEEFATALTSAAEKNE